MNIALTLAAPPATLSTRDENLRRLPADARAAFDRFQAAGDPTALDPVINAILEDFVPRSPELPLAEMSGCTQLVADLGFDSLAIAELVFFTEDLFGITISNDEIVRVRTLDDLRGFVRGKASDRRAS